MSLECLKEAPNYYKLILHIIGGLSVPVNSLGIYLVMRHSPKNSSYKYCQLYMQLVTLMVELHMSWTCPGYYYFPLMGGINTNEFMAQYVQTHASVVIYFFLFAFELPSILACFIYRNEAASEMETTMRMPRPLTYFIGISSHTFPFVVVILLLKSRLTYEQKRDLLEMYYPTCLFLVDIESFEAYDYRVNHYTAAVGLAVMGYVVLYYSYALFLAIQTLKILQKMRKHMSAATYKMHLTAIVTLVLQCVCPFVFVCIPISIIINVIIFNAVEYTALATNTMFMITAHSMMSTITMISCNSKHRELVITPLLKIFRCEKCVPKSGLVEPSLSIVRSKTERRSERQQPFKQIRAF